MTVLTAILAAVGIATVTVLLVAASLWFGVTLAFTRAGPWGLLTGLIGAAGAVVAGITTGIAVLL